MVPQLLNRWLVGWSCPFAAVILMWCGTGVVYAQEDSSAAFIDEAVAVQQDAETADGPLAGHSYHGETFNEGPRQAAYLMGTTGNVHMEIATDSEDVQQYFDQGVGQLHGFWYLEAERSFRHAAAIDPDCAMLYWGMAMANYNNRKRAQGFIAEAVERVDNASGHDAMWINALDAYLEDDGDRKDRARQYVKDLEAIIHEYPENIEAKAFLAVAIWHNSQARIPINSHETVDALLQQVFAVEPFHPAHHYAIHLWDHVKGERALRAAARCGPSSPGIAHMWHMPGHTYSDLKRYADAVFQQEASARVDHAHMMRDGLMPDQIFNFAHNNEWLIRNLMYVGRVHDAVDLAKNMTELPRHPAYNTIKGGGSARFGRMRLFQVLRTFELWPQLIDLCDTVYLEPTHLLAEQVNQAKHLAIAHYQSGNLDRGDAYYNSVKLIAALGGHRTAESAATELSGYEALARGDAARAVEIFEDVRRFDRCTLAMTYLDAGNVEEAIRVAEEAVERGENQVRPLACLASIQHHTGHAEDAAATFERLRVLSEDIDLDIPLFARLESLAGACGKPADWRMPRADPGDLEERPQLDTLGPMHWSPSPAEHWALSDADGATVSLSDYGGRPVIVIFYLGYGCLHCVEQLETFAPMTERFKQAGIEIVAISTDPVEELRTSEIAYEADGSEVGSLPFPFTLVSDSALDTFRKYRCYDDFEEMELHGTFLIDGNGLIRWQDISYEPFTNAEFLLKEATRLLAQPDVLTMEQE